MYSTVDGAKKCAKALKRVFDDSGFLFPLAKCQLAIAKAGGFRDWHDLASALAGSDRPLDGQRYRSRLLAALPEPCRSPARAWLDNEPLDRQVNPEIPRRWFRDTLAYTMAATAWHRSTPLLMPGSGVGQKLRQRLVIDLLLDMRVGLHNYPLLEPDTLAIVYFGDLRTLYGEDVNHPRFEQELATLVAAKVLDWREGEMRVMPPQSIDLHEEVVRRKIDMAAYRATDNKYPSDEADALRDALSAVGVDDALRIAEAIVKQGAAAYTTPSGPVLTLMSDLAERGDIEILARAYKLFATVQSANAAFVRETIPAKISTRYFGTNRSLKATQVMSWAGRTPQWSASLKAQLEEPQAFAETVDAMATEITAVRS